MPRRKLDAYYTPGWAVHKLLENTTIYGTVLEPCAGKGAISNHLQNSSHLIKRVITNDIDPNCNTNYNHDARTFRFPSENTNWVVTNPPFSQAFEILKNCYSFCDNVAMLLRLSFLEPTYERGEWLADNPPEQIVVLPRISFTGDGKTDSVTCAWMVWQKSDTAKDPIIICPKTKQQK